MVSFLMHDISVFDAKRLIGRKFDDVEVQSDKGGKPYIKVEYRGEEKEFICLYRLCIVYYFALTSFISYSLQKKSTQWPSSR